MIAVLAMDTPRPAHGSDAALPGELAKLALHFADIARTVGLAVERVSASRLTSSRSHYIRLRDRWGCRWLVRVSDHPRRARAEAGDHRRAHGAAR